MATEHEGLDIVDTGVTGMDTCAFLAAANAHAELLAAREPPVVLSADSKQLIQLVMSAWHIFIFVVACTCLRC